MAVLEIAERIKEGYRIKREDEDIVGQRPGVEVFYDKVVGNIDQQYGNQAGQGRRNQGDEQGVVQEVEVALLAYLDNGQECRHAEERVQDVAV